MTPPQSYELKHSFDEAMVDYDEAIRLDPKYIKAYKHRAQIYDARKDAAAAAADRAKAKELAGK